MTLDTWNQFTELRRLNLIGRIWKEDRMKLYRLGPVDHVADACQSGYSLSRMITEGDLERLIGALLRKTRESESSSVIFSDPAPDADEARPVAQEPLRAEAFRSVRQAREAA